MKCHANKNTFCRWVGADYAQSQHTVQKSAPTGLQLICNPFKSQSENLSNNILDLIENGGMSYGYKPISLNLPVGREDTMFHKFDIGAGVQAIGGGEVKVSLQRKEVKKQYH